MNETIKMIVVLSVITGLSGLTLAGLRQATATPIEEQVLAELGILRLFPKPVVVAELDRTIRESRLRLRRKDADLA